MLRSSDASCRAVNRRSEPKRSPVPEICGIPFVTVTRGPRVESVHAIAACIADVRGRIVLALGDIDVPVYLRSSAKPFIAAAIVRAGCAERFGFDDREIAVIAASHNGEPFHVDAVASILRKIGVASSALRCGAHPPGYEPAAAALVARGEHPSQLHNNCSGKHAGILALARCLGAPLQTYLDRDHPAEAEILAFCERVSGDVFDDDRLGVDGCGIPVYAVSLRTAARSYARFATLEDLDAPDADALFRVRSAIAAHPEMVAGTGRFDTALARATRGTVVGKAGAEGVQGCAITDGYGLVLKVVDGARRAAAPAAMAMLDRFGVVSATDVELAAFRRVAIRNVAGLTVGEITSCATEATWARGAYECTG